MRISPTIEDLYHRRGFVAAKVQPDEEPQPRRSRGARSCRCASAS